MQITINIPDRLVLNLKYILLGLFIILTITYAYFFKGANNNIFLLLAVIFAIYMALNLGANDVANNMGPAVGAKALTLGQAILIAIIFEASGAFIAGADVVNTIKGGIINPSNFSSGSIEFIAIMLATLLGSAIWVNIATFFKAPVSITHSVLGGILGAGITSAGLGVVNWDVVLKVIIALIIAILMGGFIAVIIFISIKKTILKKPDKGEAAKNWVPVYIALMVLVFSLYLILKGFKHKIGPIKEILETNGFNFTTTSFFISIILSISVYIFLVLHFKNKKKSYFNNSKDFVNKLFNLPLIFAVALLSFAHGANDVANAIGPLVAINDTIQHSGGVLIKVGVPIWIMVLGALSLSFGLAIFGFRLIKTVGKNITKLNQTRAYSVALAAAITVIIASGLGIPVSTTQIALGGIFGIGLYRQFLKYKKGKSKRVIQLSKLRTILLSWIVTFPVAGLISSIIYITIIYLNN